MLEFEMLLVQPKLKRGEMPGRAGSRRGHQKGTHSTREMFRLVTLQAVLLRK